METNKMKCLAHNKWNRVTIHHESCARLCRLARPRTVNRRGFAILLFRSKNQHTSKILQVNNNNRRKKKIAKTINRYTLCQYLKTKSS